MLIKSVAALVLATAGFASGTPSHPATPRLTASHATRAAAGENSPWFDTNSNAAGSRANPTEKSLSPTSVTNVEYLRSVASPVISPKATCTDSVVAPVLAGGSLYAMTNGELSKFDAATGKLIWRKIPDPTFSNVYDSVAISGNLVVVGGSDCTSESEPPGFLVAYNATTGALAWETALPGAGPLDDATIAQSFVVAEGADAAGSEVAVLNLANGKTVWSEFGCGSGAPAEVVGGIVMSNGCTNGRSDLQANNLATGSLLWTLPGNWFIQRGDLSGAAGKHLFATVPSGAVEGLNPVNGQTQYTLTNAVSVLAVDSSQAYATCGGQKVCAYNTTTGALNWQSSPSLVFKPALAAEANGVLYLDFGAALNTATGKVITTIWAPFSFNPSSLPTALAVGDGRIAVVSDPRVLDLFGLPGS